MGDIGRGLIAVGAGLAVMTGMMTGAGQGYAAGNFGVSSELVTTTFRNHSKEVADNVWYARRCKIAWNAGNPLEPIKLQRS